MVLNFHKSLVASLLSLLLSTVFIFLHWLVGMNLRRFPDFSQTQYELVVDPVEICKSSLIWPNVNLKTF